MDFQILMGEVCFFWEDRMLLREIYYVMFWSQYGTTKNRSIWYALVQSHENLGCIPAKSCIPEPQMPVVPVLMFDPTWALTDLMRLALIFIFEIKVTKMNTQDLKTLNFQILSFWVLDIQILKPWWKGSTEILWLTWNAGGRSQEHGTEAYWWRGGKIQSAAAWGSNLKSLKRQSSCN